MSDVASITFPFDGTSAGFDRVYDAVADLDLDIGTYAQGTIGVIEFMIDDYGTFKKRVARRAAELGLELTTHDHLLDGPKT